MARAAELLENTRDMTSIRRLARCACRALSLVQAFPTRPEWSTFSFKEVIHRHEEHFLELALKDAGGRVTKAAQLLGLPGHQTLLSILTRHQNLLKARTPATPRRQGIIGNAARKAGLKASRKSKRVRILHVEDDNALADLVKETLAQDGSEVEVCGDGAVAMKKIASHTRYDLLLLDYDLPGVNGVQLVKHARRFFHRRRTPIILLSALLDEGAARKAGADAFLRKPEGVMAVAETVERLLKPSSG